MTALYNGIWKLLVDKKLSKASLRKEAALPPTR